MWEEKHLQLLRQGPQVWNKWRQSNADIAPELTGIALALNERRWGPEQGGPINFKQAKLGSVNFSYAALPGANFEFAILDRCDLTGARLVGARFRGASLRNVHFAAADLQHADFTDADLRGADFRGALHLHAGQIQGARGDLNTQLPEYIVPPISWRPTERRAGTVSPGSQPINVKTARGIPNVKANPAPRNKSISMIAIAAAGLAVIGGVVAIQFALNRSPSKPQQIAAKVDQNTASRSDRAQVATKEPETGSSAASPNATSSEAAAWGFVQSNPTHDILHGYLVTFPNGIHAREVQEQYDRLEANKALQRAQIAAARADAAAWAKVKLNPNHDSLHDYLVKYPDGKYAAQAQVQYDLLEQQEAQQRAKVAQRRTKGEPLTTGTIRRAKDPIADKLLAIRRDDPGGTQKLPITPAFERPSSTEPALQLQRGAGVSGSASTKEQAEWRKVQARPTRHGLRNFIIKFPKSANVKIAKFQLAALNAEFAKRNSQKVSKAKARILAIIKKNQQREKVEWAKVQKNPTTEVLQAFIVANPQSEHVQIAKLQLTALRAAYAPAPAPDARQSSSTVSSPTKATAPTPEQLQAREEEDAESRAFALAKARILSFARKSAREDKAAWQKVLKSPSQKSLRAYLYNLPHGDQAGQARRMITELLVRQERDKADKAAWIKVKKRPTRKALRRYLVTYRDGKYVGAARKRLSALQSRAARRRVKKKASVATKASNNNKTY